MIYLDFDFKVWYETALVKYVNIYNDLVEHKRYIIIYVINLKKQKLYNRWNFRKQRDKTENCL